MSDESVREFVRTELAAMVPTSWTIIPAQRFPETISTTTAIIQHTRISRLVAAPLGHLEHEITISVIDPHTDITTAENELDDAITEVLTALDGHPDIRFTDATKTMHNDAYAAWNMTFRVLSRRPTPTP